MKFLKKGETTEEREERHVFENFSLYDVEASLRVTDLKI
jgi:hypothetical protein